MTTLDPVRTTADAEYIVVAPDAAAPWQVLPGEALAALRALPDGSCDALITDPPYSSGGMMRSDRMAAPNDKYSTRRDYQHYSGDNRDGRSWAFWCVNVPQPLQRRGLRLTTARVGRGHDRLVAQPAGRGLHATAIDRAPAIWGWRTPHRLEESA